MLLGGQGWSETSLCVALLPLTLFTLILQKLSNFSKIINSAFNMLKQPTYTVLNKFRFVSNMIWRYMTGV